MSKQFLSSFPLSPPLSLTCSLYRPLAFVNSEHHEGIKGSQEGGRRAVRGLSTCCMMPTVWELASSPEPEK